MEKHSQFKHDLANASNIVSNQLDKLRMLDKKFFNMDGVLNSKIVDTLKKGDAYRAKVLANELSNLRKIKSSTQNLSLALEVVAIRFTTINEFAEVLETVSPMLDTIKEIQKDISTTGAAANSVFSEMSTLTSDVLNTANVDFECSPISSSPIDSDALEILSEIQSRLEEDTRSRLPIPSTEIFATEESTNKKSSIESHEYEDALLVES